LSALQVRSSPTPHEAAFHALALSWNALAIPITFRCIVLIKIALTERLEQRKLGSRLCNLSDAVRPTIQNRSRDLHAKQQWRLMPLCLIVSVEHASTFQPNERLAVPLYDDTAARLLFTSASLHRSD
jgi:hypothetical protein